MKKRLLSLLLVVAMGVTMLAGCGGSDSGDSSAKNDAQQETTGGENGEAEDGAAGETAKIIMTYLTTGTTPADLQLVQDEINKISKEAINVEVELKTVSIAETFTGTYSMWIGSGEQIDLMCVAFSGLNDYVTTGQLKPLDDLLASDGQYISSLAEEYPLYDGATLDGAVYGVTPVQQAYGMRGGLVVRKDYFEETGIEYKDQYSYEEITEVIAKIKEAHPDIYPVCQLGSSITSSASSSNFFFPYDALGATIKSGVLMDTDSTEIVNLFATDEYYNYLKLMRDWYEAGYIMPDAATTDASGTELLAAGKSSALPMNLQPVQTTGTVQSYGWESIALNITEGFYSAASAASGVYWTIPVTSANPSAAMKFLNLMYENQAVADLLKSGIEGTHYVKTDTEYVIAFPEGVTMENTTYFMPLGLYGDRRYELQTSEGASIADNEAWTANNMKNTFKAVGYSYNSANMSNQLIAIATVLDQYLPSLETGSVADLDTTYNEMLSALETAGINEVIADNQAQFDAWLAEQQKLMEQQWKLQFDGRLIK